MKHPLAPLDDITNLRPDDVKDAVEKAIKNGINVATDKRFQSAFAHLLGEFKKREKRFSPHTLRRLEVSWRKFVEWCVENKQHSLPAAPNTVEQFLQSKESTLHRNTLSIYSWAISRIHRISGCPDPSKDIYVQDRLAAIKREKITNGEGVKQASPFNEQHLDQVTSLWLRDAKLINRRNLALLAVAYESMLRASELANIQTHDLKIDQDNYATLAVPVSKNNKSNKADTRILSQFAVGLILDYTEMANINLNSEGYLFRGVSKHNSGINPSLNKDTKEIEHKPLSTKTIEYVFHRAWQALTLEQNNTRPFTAHSARVGAAQDLLRKGFSVLQIQQAGGWSTGAMVYQYGRDILARDSAMARSRANQQRR